jgi:2-methylisocitrate lyase-like PEP mutase family enzyme
MAPTVDEGSPGRETLVYPARVNPTDPTDAATGRPAPTTPGDRLRRVLAELPADGAVVMPGVWDALSVRMVAAAGFPVAFVSGYCVAGTLLGEPDVGLLTQTEMAEVARRVCASSPDTLVVVDADTGYGNPVNVVRTVAAWEAAGAAGMFLEDQVWPKKCGHMAGKQVVPREDWLAKLRAACDHRTHLHVTARTDARAVLGLGEALERARMARDLGVDALFIEAPESIAELEAIAAALPDVTLVANMVETGKTPLLTGTELAALGFRLVVSPLSALFSMVSAVQTSLATLRAEGSLRGHLDRLVAFDDFTALVDLGRVQDLEQRYASAPGSGGS